MLVRVEVITDKVKIKLSDDDNDVFIKYFFNVLSSLAIIFFI